MEETDSKTKSVADLLRTRKAVLGVPYAERTHEVSVLEIHDAYVVVSYPIGGLIYYDWIPWQNVQFLRVKVEKKEAPG